jgi:CubicO group peptidase (beta-lactamase class C family)
MLERGAFRFDDLVSHYLPHEFEDIRLSHLLTHTSGLPAWLDLTSVPDSSSRVTHIAKASRLFAPGTRVLYSDLNYILLGYVMEKIGERPLDVLFIEEVADPLGMHQTRYGPRNDGPIAATEWDAGTGTFLSGVVHDENARSAGGISGHAGLFGTVQDLLLFGQNILRPATGWLAAATVTAWKLPRTAGIPGELRAWGFQKPYPLSSAGDLMSDQAVGHTGFTGTSLWIDPTYNVVMVLLTNRVHLGRSLNAPIRLRPIYHNLVLSGLEQ